jgi:hypothetical protein
MAKAQQEVIEAPPAETAGDFGEGASAYILTCGMIATVVMFLVMGGLFMYAFDRWVTNWVSPGVMLIISGSLLQFIAWVWMTIVAFIENMIHGVVILVLGPFGCAPFIYGVMKLDSVMWPFGIWCFGTLMATGGWVANAMGGPE